MLPTLCTRRQIQNDVGTQERFELQCQAPLRYWLYDKTRFMERKHFHFPKLNVYYTIQYNNTLHDVRVCQSEVIDFQTTTTKTSFGLTYLSIVIANKEILTLRNSYSSLLVLTSLNKLFTLQKRIHGQVKFNFNYCTLEFILWSSGEGQARKGKERQGKARMAKDERP